MKICNANDNRELVSTLSVADTCFARMRGLLGKKRLDVGEALLIRPCKGIHTFGMRFPIDVLFLNKQNTVVALYKNLVPNRLTKICLTAASVLELPAGIVESCGVCVGDHLIIT